MANVGWTRFAGAGALLCCVALVASGCSPLAPDGPEAARVATAFADAIAAGEAEDACSLLVPGTVAELESTDGAGCAEVILTLDLPGGGAVVSSEAFGRASLVHLDNDAVFLVADGDAGTGGWLVWAAGCRPRAGQPYECVVKGP
jgi:hypothetical protein